MPKGQLELYWGYILLYVLPYPLYDAWYVHCMFIQLYKDAPLINKISTMDRMEKLKHDQYTFRFEFVQKQLISMQVLYYV